MNKKRKVGDWVVLKPYSGFVKESDRLIAEIIPMKDLEYLSKMGYKEGDNQRDFMDIGCPLCDDSSCVEWHELLSEPDPDNDMERHFLYHVSECQMMDAPEERITIAKERIKETSK